MIHQGFMGDLKNLATPEAQMGLLQNPMFGAGMGLLSARYDSSINPFGAALEGVSQAQEQKLDAEKRQRDEQMRQQLAAFFDMQGPQQGQQAPLGPISQPPPQGLMPAPPPQGPFQGQIGMSPVSPQGLNLDMVSPLTADLMRRYAMMNIGG